MKKKLLFSLLLVFMCFALVGCGKDEGTNGGGTGNGNDVENGASGENKNMTDEEKFLAKVGVKFSDIEPDEEYYRYEFDLSNEEFTFYMEKGTERNIGKYAHKLYSACKGVSNDNKIYKASLNFYMNDGSAEEYLMKSESEINEASSFMYIDQFGYYYGNLTIAVTLGAMTDMDGERGDDVYYPVYTVSFIW